ncbi:hypothetical protein Rsub_11897 [Raphidocelis subcapitata]|uniref:Uncharacterized protein n=1 Tax=Raphidocelis subcapitata TaxID=307507 RepID=A0A2V0PGV2_9CHLO|nr:hypothetical protein Rsub_11897 [Raphidocelis subcapitata]|eukprot:GBF99088.1 hypothetical protein Rsub_11897 [Raphidocelis subcapitata]
MAGRLLRDRLLPPLAARAAELRAFGGLLRDAAASGRLPALSDVPAEVATTGAAAAALAAALLVSPRCRRALLDAADTALATALLVVLAAVLMSLPLGTLYVSYRGLLHLGASLADSHPLLAKLLPQAPPPA